MARQIMLLRILGIGFLASGCFTHEGHSRVYDATAHHSFTEDDAPACTTLSPGLVGPSSLEDPSL